MPQYPQSLFAAKNPSGQQVQLLVDAAGSLIVDTADGATATRFNITVPTVVKAAPVTVFRASVTSREYMSMPSPGSG